MKTLKQLVIPTVCLASMTATCLFAASAKSNGNNSSSATTTASTTATTTTTTSTTSTSGASAAASSSGGFLLAAPGVVTGSMVETRAPFSTSKNLGRYYKYTFRGVETKGATTGSPGNSANANGGLLHIWAGVNGNDSAKITFRDELEYNSSPVITQLVNTPIVYSQQNISVNWKGNGNAHAPNGYVTIVGEGTIDPKTPKGTLNVKNYATEGTTFKLGWTVTRDY